jgi:DNA-binding transcriptional LysR family regulator
MRVPITVVLSHKGAKVELRDIEIFLALADELHFGRTAERLHVSQARVSQAIKKQERLIGAPLFDRTSRTVALTPIGRRLREDLRQASDLIQAGLARASTAAEGTRGTIRLGAMAVTGNHIHHVIEAARAERPECDVEITEFHFSDPFGRLRAGEADVQLMWLPIREPDLSVSPIVLTEGRVLAVSTTSDLASRETVSMEDLGGRTVLDPGEAVPDYWAESMIPRRTPSGRPVPRGPAARTFHEILALVAGAQIVCPLNEHVPWYYTHPGITFVPIHDAPLLEWAFVWPTASTCPHLKAFVRAAQDVGLRAVTKDM